MLGVSSAKSLPKEQNDRLREILAEMVRRAGGNQSAVARQLGVKQSTVWAILSERQGGSLQIAMRVAKALGRDTGDVLGLKSATDQQLDETDPVHNRAVAILAARMIGVKEEAIGPVRAEPPVEAVPEWWFSRIWMAHQQIILRSSPIALLPQASANETRRRGTVLNPPGQEFKRPPRGEKQQQGTVKRRKAGLSG